VAYVADVFWTSPQEFLVEFVDTGVQNVSSETTTAIITGLFPDTEYRFAVSALTDVGQGEEVIMMQKTAPALDGMWYIPLNYIVSGSALTGSMKPKGFGTG
jgi:hypothetical protein